MKKRAITVPDETAKALTAAADLGAGSVGELLRLAALQPTSVQRAYLDGMRAEVDARIARFDRRVKSAAGGSPTAPAAVPFKPPETSGG